MISAREKIHTPNPFYLISSSLQKLQISCQASRLAGNINHSFHTKINDLSSAFGCTPSLGGSNTIRSGTSPRSSITFNTSPAQKVQLSSPFKAAFSFAASTASSTISTPTTFFATGARICAIVPVPL